MIPIFLGDRQDGQGPSAIAMIDTSDPHWMQGVLAPCNTSVDGSTPFFVLQHDGATGDGPFDKSIHEAYFDFSINYRGVWETRVYMRENEKWGSDILTMAELWKELVPKMADLYRAANGRNIPDTDYFGQMRLMVSENPDGDCDRCGYWFAPMRSNPQEAKYCPGCGGVIA